MTEIFNRGREKKKRQLLRNNMTISERKIWSKLRSRQFNGIKYRRQYSIGPYIVDFYSPELRLVIEIDGNTHFTDEARKYDEVRQNYIESLGLKVVRFTNVEIMNNIEGVFRILIDLIKQLDPTRRPPSVPPS